MAPSGNASIRAIEIADQAERHFAEADSSGRAPALFIPRGLPVAMNLTSGWLDYGTIDDAFPAVDPGMVPLGSLVLVQIRLMPLRTPGGLVITDDERATQHDNEQVTRVIAVGPLAFRDRGTMKLWPEGAWCAPGDFVRVPKYQGDYFQVDIVRGDPGVADKVRFALYKDLAITAKYTADPLTVRTFL